MFSVILLVIVVAFIVLKSISQNCDNDTFKVRFSDLWMIIFFGVMGVIYYEVIYLFLNITFVNDPVVAVCIGAMAGLFHGANVDDMFRNKELRTLDANKIYELAVPKSVIDVAIFTKRLMIILVLNFSIIMYGFNFTEALGNAMAMFTAFVIAEALIWLVDWEAEKEKQCSKIEVE
jgi:hypothetical protein